MNLLGAIGKLVGVGSAVRKTVETAERASGLADTWLPSDADAQRFLLTAWTTLAPGLNVALAVAAICLGVAAVGPWLVGSIAWLTGIAAGPAAEPDLTAIGLLVSLVVTGRGADLFVQYLLDRAYAQARGKEPPA